MLKTEKLLLGRRPKSANNVKCLPLGDGLPVWAKLPLDAKLPMMAVPRGNLAFCTTAIGEPVMK